jgi:hypothetical protein
VVAAVAAGPHDPRPGSFNCIAARQNDEALGVRRAADCLDGDVEVLLRPGDESVLGVGGVGPDDGDLRSPGASARGGTVTPVRPGSLGRHTRSSTATSVSPCSTQSPSASARRWATGHHAVT